MSADRHPQPVNITSETVNILQQIREGDLFDPEAEQRLREIDPDLADLKKEFMRRAMAAADADAAHRMDIERAQVHEDRLANKRTHTVEMTGAIGAVIIALASIAGVVFVSLQ